MRPSGVTAKLPPPLNPNLNLGYFEYGEHAFPDLQGEGLALRSVPLDDAALERADIVCVVTAHSGIDYQRIGDRARLVMDFRNVVPRSDGRVHTL